MVASLYEMEVIKSMNYFLSAMFGLVQVCEYSTKDSKTRIFLSFLKIAIIFTILGLNLGRAGF